MYPGFRFEKGRYQGSIKGSGYSCILSLPSSESRELTGAADYSLRLAVVNHTDLEFVKKKKATFPRDGRSTREERPRAASGGRHGRAGEDALPKTTVVVAGPSTSGVTIVRFAQLKAIHNSGIRKYYYLPTRDVVEVLPWQANAHREMAEFSWRHPPRRSTKRLQRPVENVENGVGCRWESEAMGGHGIFGHDVDQSREK